MSAITKVYNDFLGREPSVEEKTSWEDKIASGEMTEEQVIIAVQTSTEAQTYFTSGAAHKAAERGESVGGEILTENTPEVEKEEEVVIPEPRPELTDPTESATFFFQEVLGRSVGHSTINIIEERVESGELSPEDIQRTLAEQYAELNTNGDPHLENLKNRAQIFLSKFEDTTSS